MRCEKLAGVTETDGSEVASFWVFAASELLAHEVAVQHGEKVGRFSVDDEVVRIELTRCPGACVFWDAPVMVYESGEGVMG